MLPVVNELIRQRQNRLFKTRRREYRENFDINILSDNRFIELFRVNKDLFFHIENLLTPFMHAPRYINSDAVPVRQKLLCALRFYATGCYQRSIGEDFNLSVSQTSISRYDHTEINSYNLSYNLYTFNNVVLDTCTKLRKSFITI